MKKLLLVSAISAMLVPSLSMAQSVTLPAQDTPVAHEVNDLDHPHKGHHKHGKKGERPNFKEMTEAEKQAFFDKRIAEMEAHHEKMGKKLEELKAMSPEERAKFFENKKKKGGKKHDKFKKACKKLEHEGREDFSYEKAMERMKNSKKYQNGSEEKRAKMEQRLNDFNALSDEEKAKKIAERKAKMQAMCDDRPQ